MVFLLFFGLIACSSGPKIHPSHFDHPPLGMVLIPEGRFIMGSHEAEGVVGVEVGVDELPKHEVYLPAFYMDRYEVTNGAYKAFVDQTRRWKKIPGYWVNKTYPLGSREEPVSDTDWYDATEYCAWLGKRLPSEAEWEKAARGIDGRIWPWGDRFWKGEANTAGERHAWKRPVGLYPNDRSPFGVYDVVGNVREWTSSWYQSYPNSALKRTAFGKSFRVLKGGSYADSGANTRLAHRMAVRATHDPDGDRAWHTDLANGFRCAMNLKK